MMIGLLSGTYSSIFIASPVLTHWKEREPAYRRRRERIEEQMGRVPAFPDENVVQRVEGGPEEPIRAETPVPAAPAPSRADTPQPSQSQVPGVVPEPPGPVAPPPAPEPAEPPAPVGAPDGGDGQPDAGDAQPDGADGADEAGGDGAESPRRELSEASAAALRRVREQQGGGRKKRRKHGRNR
jgi:SecD/SecF fusion protein